MSKIQRLVLRAIQILGLSFILYWGWQKECRLDWGEVGRGFALAWVGGMAMLILAKAIQRRLPGYDEEEEMARILKRREELFALEEEDMRRPLLTFLLYPGTEGFFFVPLLYFGWLHPAHVVAAVMLQTVAAGSTGWRELTWMLGVLIKAAVAVMLLPNGFFNLLVVMLLQKAINMLFTSAMRKRQARAL